ncbi:MULTISPECIES: ATP-binding protein [unclassified Streptomyces]|uniref:ATP-binding protein n=1 Tax=unclassified Streptomyces TaxID=2593676 RepID=UPI002E2BFF5B|nr:ATP-binding protein [Streptomyces sp. NBC_01423]
MTPLQEQRPVTASVFTQRYSATRRGAALARRLALWQLDAWGIPYGTSLSDTVALLVAELAANAVLHGRVPGRDFELRLVHTSETGVVRVEVSDTHDARPDPLLVSQPDADADGGRGLLIVDAVATSWGVRDRVGPGKTVWAEAATTLPVAPGTD